MSIPLPRALAAAAFAAAIGLAARRAGALDRSGAAAAWGVGTATVAGGGWRAGAAMVAFFAASSLLSRAGNPHRSANAQARGSERDAVQVAANGGVAAAAALAMGSGLPGRERWRGAFYGSIAAASSDTWSTEIGRRSPIAPRMLIAGRSVPPGTSGGMTPLGTAGGAAGAATIAAVAALDTSAASRWDNRSFARAFAAGVAGAAVDSLLGATAQSIRRCPACGQETERLAHCGIRTVHARGLPWLDNDGVNAAATMTGAAIGWLLAGASPIRPATGETAP